ncbi:MAG: hypothetical protein Q4D24_12385 [Erysipelotrichaceae bacterium]|nr:hypothetical protein [Erysipelotrichaceae bacterium]
MIYTITTIGIILVFVVEYLIQRHESNNLFGFFKSISLYKTIEQILIVVLSATIAIEESKWKQNADSISEKLIRTKDLDNESRKIEDYQKRIKLLRAKLDDKQKSEETAREMKNNLRIKSGEYNSKYAEIRKMRTDFIGSIIGKDNSLEITFAEGKDEEAVKEMLVTKLSTVGKNMGKTVMDGI